MADEKAKPLTDGDRTAADGLESGQLSGYDYNIKQASAQEGNLPVVRLADLAILPPTNGRKPASNESSTEIDTNVDLLGFGISDDANARTVHALYRGSFLYSEQLGWLSYTGTHWTQESAQARVDRAIVHTLGERIKAAVAVDAEAHEKLIKFCVPNASRVRGAREMLESLADVSHRHFDAEPHLLNCPNGVVDLRTGAIISHSPSQRFLHVAGVEYIPSADSTLWVSWLTEAVGGDIELVDWLQMAVGYTLTGHTREEVLFYLYGPPRSGKGTFTETLKRAMGPQLSAQVDFSTFTASRDVDSQNFALAPLKPARFVVASESNTYERFNEAKVKALTGGDEVFCAFKHRTHFNYRPQFKIWLASNQPVNADPDDDAVWARIRLVEFPNSYLGHENKLLKEQMSQPAVLRGVLAWAVEGARHWYALDSRGLPELQRIAVAKDLQRQEIDHIQHWIDDRCIIGNGWTQTGDLYQSYKLWCQGNGVIPKGSKSFSQALTRKGYRYHKVTQGRGFDGLVIKS